MQGVKRQKPAGKRQMQGVERQKTQHGVLYKENSLSFLSFLDLLREFYFWVFVRSNLYDDKPLCMMINHP
jgi:hypothetical protein